MKIGIIGVGAIGGVLSRKLSANGHEITVANSKGPETISEDILAFGATAGTVLDAVRNKDVLIISIPFVQINGIADIIKGNINENTLIIDTGNYYPVRDGNIDDIINGKAESIWVSEKLGRPIAKAWNSIAASILKNNGYPAGMKGRLAIPFAVEDQKQASIVIELIENTGFDACYAGNLTESYRFQPGQPSYSTSLELEELKKSLSNAHSHHSASLRREEFIKVMTKLGWPEDINSMIEISRYLNNK